MNEILRKFDEDKIRFTFDSDKELENLLTYLSGSGFDLVDNIDKYVITAIGYGSTTLLCENGTLFTSGIMKKNIRYISYKEFFGIKYDLPSRDNLMEFLGV